MAIDLHPEAELHQQRLNSNVLRTNLHNLGLRMPSCDVAYRAAIFAGASDEVAFEAARRQELLAIGSPDDIHATGTRVYPSSQLDEAASRKRRQGLIDTCRALPNPFASADQIQRGNSDLGEAA